MGITWSSSNTRKMSKRRHTGSPRMELDCAILQRLGNAWARSGLTVTMQHLMKGETAGAAAVEDEEEEDAMAVQTTLLQDDE